jgi:8-oxo-dGTP pyrophosphatase MutT (NUDIX family)
MKKLTAAGFVLARMVDDEPFFLLLHSTNSGKWLPPKGHTDDDEDALTTARRELAEETGITDIDVVPGFERTIEYEVNTRKRGNYIKRVTYLLATTRATNVSRSEEHRDAGWFPLMDAMAKLEFEQMREIIRAADKVLRSR